MLFSVFPNMNFKKRFSHLTFDKGQKNAEVIEHMLNKLVEFCNNTDDKKIQLD